MESAVAGTSGGGGGLLFEVQRCLPGETDAYTFIGNTHRKVFIDATLPAGTPSVSCRVRAHRGSKRSAWSTPVLVQLGVSYEGMQRVRDAGLAA